VLLRREGFTVNHKRLFRLYREERLMVRRRGGRKRALGTRAPMLVPQQPNERWSLDFVADQFIDGRRMRILIVVDDCSRECLALIPDTSISGIGTRWSRTRSLPFVYPMHAAALSNSQSPSPSLQPG
jgi:putative transposase